MKKKTLVVCLTVAAMLLCLPGCAEVPDDVQSEISDYESIEDNGAKGEQELIPISEIIGRPDATPQSVKQLLMSDITVNYPDAGAQAMSFELKHGNCDTKAEVERIAAEQFPGLDIHVGSENEYEKRYYSDEGASFYLDKHSVILTNRRGETRISHGGSYEYSGILESDRYIEHGVFELQIWNPYDYFPAERIISLHSGERIEEGLSYPLPAGEVKVADAMATAQSYLDDVMAGFEDNEFTYRIRKIYVRRMAEGLYGYEFTAERLYRGIPIDSTLLYPPKADMGSEGYIVEGGDNICVWMIAPDKVDYFRCGERRRVINAVPAYDNIISLESALKLISETLTSATAFKVKSVELLYINGYYADELMMQRNEEEIEAYLAVPKVTRLVWALLIDDPNVSVGSLESPHDPHHSLFVDVLTGELIGFCEGSCNY